MSTESLYSAGNVLPDVAMSIIGRFKEFISSFFSQFSASFQGLAILITAIYVIYVGYNCFKGNFREKTKEFVTSAIILIFVSHIIFNSSSYFEYIVGPITDTTFGIYNFFLSKSSGESISNGNWFTALGGMLNYFFEFADKIMPSGNPLTNLGIFIKVISALIILGICISLVTISAFSIFIVSYILMNIVLIFGCITIFFASFKETRGYFFSWLRTVLYYCITIILSGAIIALMFSLCKDSMQHIAAQDLEKDGVFTSAFVAAVVINYVTYHLLKSVWSVAASLTSSQGGGGGIFGAAFGPAANLVTTGAAAAAGFVRGRFGGRGTSVGQGGAGAEPMAYSRLRGFQTQEQPQPRKH